MKLLVYLFIIFIFSCQNHSTDVDKSTNVEYVKYFPTSSRDTILDYGIFSITAPDTWKKPNDDTLELNNCKCFVSVGRIQIGSNKFINYSYGYDVQSIFDSTHSNLRSKSFIIPNAKNYRFWEDLKNKYKIHFFRSNHVDTGFSGLYIDSIGKSKKVSFLMTAENLDSLTNINVFKALNSIQFKFKDEW